MKILKYTYVQRVNTDVLLPLIQKNKVKINTAAKTLLYTRCAHR